jgi:hypothetical protein
MYIRSLLICSCTLRIFFFRRRLQLSSGLSWFNDNKVTLPGILRNILTLPDTTSNSVGDLYFIVVKFRVASLIIWKIRRSSLPACVETVTTVLAITKIEFHVNRIKFWWKLRDLIRILQAVSEMQQPYGQKQIMLCVICNERPQLVPLGNRCWECDCIIHVTIRNKEQGCASAGNWRLF